MHAIRPVLRACCMAAGLACAPAGAQEGTLRQIVPGVWFREGETRPNTRVVLCCNSVVIEMKDSLIVVDANFPSCAQALLDDLKRVSSKPVRTVIDTHHHRDHAYGNAVFSRMGAVTLAHAGVVAEMDRYEPERFQHEVTVRKDVAALGLTTPERPRQTYTTSPYVLSDETRRVELHNFGWGHTRGDTFVYLPREKVLCTGDVVLNGPFVTTSDAHIANWPSVIRAARKLDVTHVLPGHGPAGGVDLLNGQIEFLEELQKAVAAAIDRGATLEQLVTMKDGRPQSTSIVLPRSVEHWVSLQPWKLPTQVKDTYEEMTQHRPHGEIAGGK
jgi:glyoxylase-like metal-dependent hydrolase (beta-lactamase superfamily II)